jgi:peroxiredoxin
MKNFKRIILVLIGLLVLAACGGAQEAESVSEASIMTDEVMADETMADDDAMMAEEGHDDDTDDAMMAEDSMENMAELPAWQQLELTDARTGETFTLADFSGKTVFVEPMATWCTNCRRQLGNVREARAQLNDDNVVFIGLSLETTISNADLAQYQSDQGFDWTFAVMSPEILQQLADAFGRSITSAPSTPHFVIRPDGSTTDLVTGIESVEQIAQQILDASG